MGNSVGIYLGLNHASIACLNDFGKGQIVPNADGERRMATAIYFCDTGGVYVGREALQMRYEDASRCVRWIKKHMGDANYRRVIDGKEYSPTELTALILKKLHQDAVPQIGKITNVVISIPAHFGELARKATIDAGKMAGLNVVGLVNEPAAAALYYALEHQVSGRVLVFDLGGSSFDVTIADIDGRNVEIVTTCGTHIGGYDFDQKLVGFLAEKFQQETGGPLFNSEKEKAEIEDYAEEIKKSLSNKEAVAFTLRSDYGKVRGEIRCAEFEVLISAEIAQIEMLLETVLDEAGCEPKDIEKVLLVGNSSRMPTMQNMLRRIFAFEPMQVGNLEEVKCLGAALQCGTRMDSLKADIADVCNHSLGWLMMDYDEVLGREVLRNDIVITKSSLIPCAVKKVIRTEYDDQREIHHVITQGESSDPDLVKIVANGRFVLPPGLPKGSPVDVTYSYDMEQRMTCVLEHRASGRKLAFTIDGEIINPIQAVQSQAHLGDFLVE